MGEEMDFDIDVPENIEPVMPVTPTTIKADFAVELPDVEVGSNGGQELHAIPDLRVTAVKYGVIGSGQGGSRMADSMYQIGYRRVCAINTTVQDFLGLQIPADNQLVLEAQGGAGKDIVVGSDALNKSAEDVMNLMRRAFGNDVDHIMICIGLGGGSGSGSAHGLIRLAKYYFRQLGKPENIGMIVSLPKFSEGGKVQANAYTLMISLLPLVDSKTISPFVVCDNQAIHQMFPNVPAKVFWQTANKNVVGLFDIFNVLAAQKSQYTTFDRADYRNMLSSGTIIFGATKLDKYSYDTDLSDGLRNNLKKTLLADGFELSSATHVAAILAAPDQILGVLPQSHIDLAFETLERILGGTTKTLTMHQGVYEASKMGLYLYTMVGGLKFPAKRLEILKARGGID